METVTILGQEWKLLQFWDRSGNCYNFGTGVETVTILGQEWKLLQFCLTCFHTGNIFVEIKYIFLNNVN